MSIQLADNYSLRGQYPIDDRFYAATKAELLAFDPRNAYDGLLKMCIENEHLYMYDTNYTDSETGHFKAVDIHFITVEDLTAVTEPLRDSLYYQPEDVTDQYRSGLFLYDFDNNTWKRMGGYPYEDEDIELISFFETVAPEDMGYTGDAEKIVSSEYLHTQMKNLTEIIQEEIEDIYDIAGNATYIILQNKEELDEYPLDTLKENSFNIFLVVADKTVDHYVIADGSTITVEEYKNNKSTYDTDMELKAYYKYAASSSKYDYSFVNDTSKFPQKDDVEFDSTLYGCAVFDDVLYPVKERTVYYIGKLNFNENTLEEFFRKKHYFTLPIGSPYYVPGTALTVVADSTQVVDDATQIKLSKVVMEYGQSVAVGDTVDLVAASTEEFLTNKCIFIKRNELKPEVLQYVDDEVVEYVDPEDTSIVEYVTYLTYQGTQLMPRVWEDKNIDFDDPDDYN